MFRDTRLKDAAGPLRLIDAREPGPEADEARRLGYDLNEGMLLHFRGQFYHGDAALHVLAMLTKPSGVFNRLNALALPIATPSSHHISIPSQRPKRGSGSAWPNTDRKGLSTRKIVDRHGVVAPIGTASH
jgi:hypothetical protein